MNKYAAVVVNRAIKSIDKVFHYAIPSDLDVAIGSIVLVPFGREKLEGVVVDIVSEIDFDPAKLKSVIKNISDEPVFNADLLALSRYMADYYLAPWVSCLQAMLPAGLNLTGKMPKRSVTQIIRACGYEGKVNSKNHQAVLNILAERGAMPRKEIEADLGISPAIIRTMLEKSMIEITTENIWENSSATVLPAPDFTAEQVGAIDAIAGEMLGEKRPVLMHGVTGSGKTEIYMELGQRVLAEGKQVLVLVPEIALTPQTVQVFSARLSENIAVLHSGLTMSERRETWLGIAKSHYNVVIGARSAIFAPLKNIGLIIIDEEHETTYKQDTNPRFNGRDLAIIRAGFNDAQVILGSATPSMESYYKAQIGEYLYIELHNRVLDRDMASISIANMQTELKRGNTSIFSDLLREKILATLARGEQTILFINRRGFHSFISCRECGYAIECPHCSIPMSYHKGDNALHCHYCGAVKPIPKICPNCGSAKIRYFGAGTERIAEEVRHLFPHARVERIDRDVTVKKGELERIYAGMKEGSIDILVGTQIIAKGWDVENITLVGVMAADTALKMPDFRADEHSYQLLTQVAGRSGRHKAGEVIIQTYMPENETIEAVCTGNMADFYSSQLAYRENFNYPPFSSLARLVFSYEDETALIIAAKQFKEILLAYLGEGVSIWGPTPAPYAKIKNRYRMQILIKGEDIAKIRLGLVKTRLEWEKTMPLAKKIQISFDIDPIKMM